MKVLIISLQVALILFFFLYFNKRLDEQNQEIIKLQDAVYKTQVKSATDKNYMKGKVYDLERLLQNLPK